MRKSKKERGGKRLERKEKFYKLVQKPEECGGEKRTARAERGVRYLKPQEKNNPIDGSVWKSKGNFPAYGLGVNWKRQELL